MTINDMPNDMLLSTVTLQDQDYGDPDTLTGPLWTVDDVADYLQLQPETIRSMARRGELPALKIGKVWRFHKHAIHEMLVKMF